MQSAQCDKNTTGSACDARKKAAGSSPTARGEVSEGTGARAYRAAMRPRPETMPYAVAAAAAGSSSHAPLGMGRKTWKRISAANATATTVQTLTTPCASR